MDPEQLAQVGLEPDHLNGLRGVEYIYIDF